MKHYFVPSTVALVLLVSSACEPTNSINKMETIYSWKVADYDWQSHVMELQKATGEYIPENILILDASIWEQGEKRKVFVTTPRLRTGTPASLSIVTSKTRNGQHLLRPYPYWNSWHKQDMDINSQNATLENIDCDKIISVFRTTVDSTCGRLWVLDTGFLHVHNKQVCQPKILLFDLQTDKLIGRYIIPKEVASETSLLITIVVDVRNNECDNAFAYIADVTDYKLIVYNHKRKLSWSIESNLFYPYPLDGVFNINGREFDLMDGLFGLALGPMKDNDRILYFHSLASVRESWVPTSIVRDQSLFVKGENKSPRSFKVFDGVRNSQSAAEVMSDDGALFFGLLTENSIVCWNSKLPYKQENFATVAKNDVKLQFTSGLKINNGKLWATTSRFQNYFTGAMNFSETNFRILAAPIEDLTFGTLCSFKTTSPGYTTFRPSFQETVPSKVFFPSYGNRRVAQP